MATFKKRRNQIKNFSLQSFFPTLETNKKESKRKKCKNKRQQDRKKEERKREKTERKNEKIRKREGKKEAR